MGKKEGKGKDRSDKKERKGKRKSIKKEETEEETDVVHETVQIQVVENESLLLGEDVAEVLDAILDILISRLMVVKNSFSEIKGVLVDDEHYFLQIITDFIPFYLDKTKANINIPPPNVLRDYTRQKIQKQAAERFQLSPEAFYSLQGGYVSQQLFNFLQSQSNIHLPSLSIAPSILAKDAATRTPTMKNILQDTFTLNSNEMDEMKPELADNLTTKRRDIIKKLQPLERDNEILQTLLKDWDSAGEIALPISDDNREITIRPSTVDRDAIRAEASAFQALLSCNLLGKLCTRLSQLQSWEGVRTHNLPEIHDPVLAPIQDLARRFRIFSSALENFLYEEDASKPRLVPACSLAVRLFTKSQMQLLYEVNKDEIERIQNDGEMDQNKESEISAIEKDQKFIKTVLHKWDKRTKICKRNCIWYLSLRSRTIAREDMREEEIALLQCKLGDLYLYIYEKEQEFQEIVKREILNLKNLIRLGISLGVWSSAREKKQLEELLSYSDRLTKIPLEKFPSLASSKRFVKSLSKMNTITHKIDELESVKTKIPALEVRLTKVNKNFVDNLLSTYEEELEATKHSKSKKNKEKAQQLENQLSDLKEISTNWKSKSNRMKRTDTLFTLPRTATIKDLTREERRALNSASKPKAQGNIKKLQALHSKAKVMEKPLRESYNELIQQSEKRVDILRVLERNEPPKAPQIRMQSGSLSYLSVQLITSAVARPENVSDIVDIWTILSHYLPLSDIQPYLDKQLEHFPAERIKLEGELAVREDTFISDIDPQMTIHAPPAKKGKSKQNLSDMERTGLLLLTRGFEHLTHSSRVCDTFLNTTEQNELLDFLQHMQGNSSLNSKLAEILEQDSIPFGISQDALKYCRTFTFKSRHLDALYPYTKKLQGAWAKASANEDVSKREKITLKELGVLRTMERWGKDLVRVFRLLNQENNHPMFKVLEDAVHAHHTLRSIYNAIQERINADETYQSGDLLLTVWTRKLKTMQGNRPPTAFSFLMSFTKYEHTAVIYRNINEDVGPLGEPRLSHMYRAYHDSELTLEDLASSDIFRMWTPALIKDKSTQQHLKEKFGDTWEDRIQERYCAIESGLHSGKQGKLGGITNPLSRVMNIGTAAVLPWTRIRRTNMDFEKIRNIIYEEDNKEGLQMTCSEFAAKSAIAALLELEEQLIHELNWDDKEGKRIFTLPFHAREKFKTMQPDRLRHILADHHALQKVPFPPFIESLVHI